MKSKNVARLFIFVLFLCFVFLCQSQTTPTVQRKWDPARIQWVIPKTIKDAYPQHPVKKDWKDLKRDLLVAITKLDSDIKHYKNKPLQIAKALAEHGVWLKKADGKVVSGIGPLKNYLVAELAGQRILIETISKIEWFHFPEEYDDIFATLTFTYGIQPIKAGTDHQKQDPGGGGGYGHRRICTWF